MELYICRQGLIQDFRNTCQKPQYQKFCLSRFSCQSTSNPFYQLHLIANCVKKANLHFSYVLKDGLLGKYLVITPKKSKLKFFIEIFACQKRLWLSGKCPSKRQAGRVLAKSLCAGEISIRTIPATVFQIICEIFKVMTLLSLERNSPANLAIPLVGLRGNRAVW